MMKKTALGLGVLALATSGALAESKAGTGGKQYELNDGTTFTNAGSMFQHLRDRDEPGFASGNPKDIVNAYPDQFETVGDLIHQKRVEE